MPLLAGFQPDHCDFPDVLARPEPYRHTLPRAGWLIAVLMLVCLAPRVWMAWKVDTLTEDGPVYIQSAMQLARGNYTAAFRDSNLGLNLYPVVLMVLHDLGLPWEMAGRLWGTLMAVLVVGPMFGWLRRQFNDRVAAMACLLYAAHPALLERSPELLRCPTFWLLLMGMIYLLWRAVCEVRVWLFLAAGVMFALSVHTRVEGWFALVPWTLWTAYRGHFVQCRRRLLLGAMLGLMMLPALAVLVNITWLRDHSQWEWCLSQRVSKLRQIVGLVEVPGAMPAAIGEGRSELAAAAGQDAARSLPSFTAIGEVPRSPRTLWRIVAAYVIKLVDAMSPLHGLLTLLGLWSWRRTLMRPDQLVMVGYCLVCLIAVALFWLLIHDIQGRYFFPIVLISVPYTAGGIVTLGGALMSWTGYLWPSYKPRVALANAMLVCLVAAVGCADALTNTYDDRLARREMGQWILNTLGPGQAILGSEPRAWTLAYYAQGHYYGPALEEIGQGGYSSWIRDREPAVVIVIPRRGAVDDAPWYRAFLRDEVVSSKFRPVPVECLPLPIQQTRVLVRQAVWERASLRRPPGTSSERF